MDIIVKRGLGDKEGPMVQEPILCDIRPAIRYGRYLINSNARGQEIKLTTVFRHGYKVGQYVEVSEDNSTSSWVGRIQELSYSVEDGLPKLEIVLWKPYYPD